MSLISSEVHKQDISFRWVSITTWRNSKIILMVKCAVCQLKFFPNINFYNSFVHQNDCLDCWEESSSGIKLTLLYWYKGGSILSEIGMCVVSLARKILSSWCKSWRVQSMASTIYVSTNCNTLLNCYTCTSIKLCMDGSWVCFALYLLLR